jgi:hypothetical protein
VTLLRDPGDVLTSRRTFSAAQYFAYNLQTINRAIVVAEVTGGGSHLTSTEHVDDLFNIRVPHGRPMKPITKTNNLSLLGTRSLDAHDDRACQATTARFGNAGAC